MDLVSILDECALHMVEGIYTPVVSIQIFIPRECDGGIEAWPIFVSHLFSAFLKESNEWKENRFLIPRFHS